MKTKLLFSTITILLCSIQFIHSQNTDSLINDIRNKYKEINDSLSVYSKTFGESWDESAEGNEGYAFFDKGDLRLIKIYLYGETGKTILEYYYFDDKLFFAFVTEYYYNRPAYYTGDMVSEGDEAYDPEKTTKKENRYYFAENVMIRWLDEKKKQVPSTSPNFKTKEKEVLNHSSSMKLKAEKMN